MGLPILQHRQPPSDEDLLRLFDHAEGRYVEAMADARALDVGTACSNPRLPGVYDANHIRDVALPANMAPEQAMRLAESHFAGHGTRCAYWVMNPSMPAQAKPMADHLLSLGYAQACADVMVLRRMPGIDVPIPADLMIIPARASCRHVRQLAEESAGEWEEPQLVEVAVLHLDDPQWNELLALRDGRPIARVGVLAVGDVGRIGRLYVARAFRGQGIGRVMLARILELCVRAVFRHVMVPVETDNTVALKLYRRFGFETIGTVTRYAAPWTRTRPDALK